MYEFTVDDPAGFVKPWTAQIGISLQRGQLAMQGFLRGSGAGESQAVTIQSRPTPR